MRLVPSYSPAAILFGLAQRDKRMDCYQTSPDAT